MSRILLEDLLILEYQLDQVGQVDQVDHMGTNGIVHQLSNELDSDCQVDQVNLGFQVLQDV